MWYCTCAFKTPPTTIGAAINRKLCTHFWTVVSPARFLSFHTHLQYVYICRWIRRYWSPISRSPEGMSTKAAFMALVYRSRAHVCRLFFPVPAVPQKRQREHVNLILTVCVNLMDRGPFRLLNLGVKLTLWGLFLKFTMWKPCDLGRYPGGRGVARRAEGAYVKLTF